ncbi:MAG: SufE family protein [Hahellaceae bacterium]|nr:SufE family protein [Hahellaceae bacterium]
MALPYSEQDLALFRDNPLGSHTTLDDIRENFDFLDDWESRYSYVIDLGKQAPRIPEAHRTDDHLVHGCQSQVWFIYHLDAGKGTLQVLVDSDAVIVRGLAAVVMTAFNNQPLAHIARFDMEALFAELDLVRHLSPTRGNGLRAMVKRIQATAAALLPA